MVIKCFLIIFFLIWRARACIMRKSSRFLYIILISNYEARGLHPLIFYLPSHYNASFFFLLLYSYIPKSQCKKSIPQELGGITKSHCILVNTDQVSKIKGEERMKSTTSCWMYSLLYVIISGYHREASQVSEDDTAHHGAPGGECLCNMKSGNRSSRGMADRKPDPVTCMICTPKHFNNPFNGNTVLYLQCCLTV